MPRMADLSEEAWHVASVPRRSAEAQEFDDLFRSVRRVQAAIEKAHGAEAGHERLQNMSASIYRFARAVL